MFAFPAIKTHVLIINNKIRDVLPFETRQSDTYIVLLMCYKKDINGEHVCISAWYNNTVLFTTSTRKVSVVIIFILTFSAIM